MNLILWQKCQGAFALIKFLGDDLPRHANYSTATAQGRDVLMGDGVITAATTKGIEADIPCVIYESNHDLILKTISPTVFDLIGIRPENLIEKPALWRDRLFPRDRQRLLSKLDLLGASAVACETHRIVNDRGLPVWVAHSFRKVYEDGQTVIRGCIVPVSTADHGAAIDSAVIDQFVHRLGNHFQLINLFIDSLKRKLSNLEELDEVQRTVDRAVDFTRAFSRYSQPPVLNTSVKLCDLLSSLVQTWRPHFNENGVAIENTFHPSLGDALVTADPVLLDFAMGSIFKNALEATQNSDRLIVGGRTEVVGSHRGSMALISIINTGKGMDKNEIANAVIPFNSTRRDHDGLGLSSAIRIIEFHGGAVKVTSEPGRGTEVAIMLPVDKAARCLE